MSMGFALNGGCHHNNPLSACAHNSAFEVSMDSTLINEIQQCSGELARTLMNLNMDCQCSSLDREPERLKRANAAMKMLATRERVAAVIQAVQSARWNAPYGESPYDDVVTVLRRALAGSAMPSGSTGAMRALHDLCMAQFAQPAARVRWTLDDAGRRARYRRLLRAMVNGALLTSGEAEGALRILLRTHPEGRRHCAPAAEALAHFGGNLAAVHAARRWRRLFASTARAPRAQSCDAEICAA
jgi:hypothetical protein